MSGHHHHHHGHAHHDHSQGDQSNETVLKRIRFAFILNFVFAIVELVGGLFTGSFAIVADAIHDLGDSFSLALALYLQKKSQGAPSKEMPYGYLRYSVVSAIITGIVIISGSFVVLIEAIQHLLNPEALPNVMGMIGLSIVGIAVNGIAALRLSGGHSHNEKILSWHLIEDLLGWIVVLIGAICIYFFQLNWIDPLLAIGISIFISWNVIKNLKEPFRIILQYVPGKEDLTDLQKQLEAVEGVKKIVEIQAWTLDGYQHVLTTRLNVKDAVSTDKVRTDVRAKLKEKGYKFVTIEIDQNESHDHAHDHGHDDHDHEHHHEANLPKVPPC
ncbi:MAG: cation transporter [Proteobacteria bacterium]|nr:MAG: cation transporter [Pseudomonadota bacterium]